MAGNEDVYRCTLTPGEAAERVDVDRALAARVVDTQRSAEGLRIRFDDGRETRRLVDTFVANERSCCGFFDFTVTEVDELVMLEITAPAARSAQQLVDTAQRAFEHDPDATASSDGGGPTVG